MAKSKIRRRVTINGRVQWITGANEQDYAESVVNAFNGGEAKAEPPIATNHIFRDYAEGWFENICLPNVKEATAITYRRQLDLHIYPAIGSTAIEDITSEAIQKLFNAMPDACTETKLKVKNVLNQVLNLAVDNEIILKNPLKSNLIKIRGKKSKIVQPYSLAQMQELVHLLPEIKNGYDRAFLALLALYPLRQEEALGLRWKDIYDGVIHVEQVVTHPDRNRPVIQEPKTEESKRPLAIVSDSLQHLGSGKPDDFIVGGSAPLSYTQVRLACERIRKDTGFSEPITPRRFRTTVLTDLYEQTKDIKLVQKAAGHTTANMTLKYYVKGRAMDKHGGGSHIERLRAYVTLYVTVRDDRKPLRHRASSPFSHPLM